NLVSLAIFSWSRIQPNEMTWNFDWLDRVIDLLNEGGIRVNLATATASPPPWLSHAHPEMLPMLADGTRLWHGARQQYCPSSPVYRAAAQRLVEAMAERYAKHSALAMWHVGNEFGCHVPACYCDVSAEAFRQWLRRRYATMEELNRAWGTDFWSQRYSSWDEIIPPRRTPTWPNPSQELDFMRFSSDALLECYENEHDVLTRLSPNVPVTTNFMSFFKPLDYWKWSEREDVVSNDSYPDPSDPSSTVKAAMAGDLMRSLGRGRPWILMEQSTNRVNWREINVAKPPGLMRLWSYQALARGADGIMFFQWRQSRAGAEKFHSAMVPHGPLETSPVWREVKTLGAELSRLDAIGDTRTQADVAILFDWESWWALELPSKPSTAVRQIDQVEAIYRPFYEANVTVDFARPQDDLSEYRLVIAPSLYLVTDEAAANLERFVRGGGVLLMTFFSGIVDAFEHIRLGGYPKPFAEVLGISVIDFHPLASGEEVGLRFADGTVGQGSIWSEQIELRGAEAIATFGAGGVAGGPAITSNRFGDGTAIYVGTRPDPAAFGRVLKSARAIAGVVDDAAMPQGIEVVRRGGRGKQIHFLLNHRDVAVDVPVEEPGRNLVDGADVHRGLIRLQPRGVAVIQEGW
ncbi:MAG TPA: beta-galactosidase, partial [Vicinamibacterales bacterium]